MAALFSLESCLHAVPIVILPTTNFSQGNATNAGLFGAIYNFTAVNVPAANYSVGNILNNTNGFNPVLVGGYSVNTGGGIHYGNPNPSDALPLTTWLNGDGSTVVYNGAPHITPVFQAPTGTLLNLTGYLRITPAMVGIVQTFSLGLDDGGKLTINGQTVIDNGGIHGAAVITQTAIFTAPGLYPVSLGYYDGHATQAVLTGTFAGGALFVTTPGGVQLQGIQLDGTATEIQTYIGKVGGASPSDPTLNNALNSLSNLALSGVSGDVYGAALKELSPLKYAALGQQTMGTIDFITNDLDDYLAHRRTDAGFFRSGNGLDLGGISVSNADVDPALQNISEHLLAFNGAGRPSGTISDSPAGLCTHSLDAQETQRWNFFTRGIVVLSQNLSSGGLQHTDATSGTLQFGADYQLTPHLLVGTFFNYAHSNGSLDEEGSEASSNSYIPGLYASYANGGWYANGLTAGGVSNFDVKRNISFPGFVATAHANPTGIEEYTYLSGGRDFHAKNWTFGPIAGLQYVHGSTDSFTENGAGGLDLSVNSHDDDSLRSRLGGRIYYATTGEGVVWRPFLDATWQHEFMENSNSFSSQFQGADVGTFTVATPATSRDSALISVGTDIDLDKSTDVFTVYRMEAGASNFFAQSVEAGVKITF